MSQCLRVMLAVLPKRSSDEISGELFVAAYQKKLGHLCNDAISFIADKAMERCQWFPTIHECLEIATEWRRNDEFTKRRAEAARLAGQERRRREDEEREWARIKRGSNGGWDLTQEAVDKLTPELVRLGLGCGSLMHNDEGKVVPWRPKPGEVVW